MAAGRDRIFVISILGEKLKVDRASEYNFEGRL